MASPREDLKVKELQLSNNNLVAIEDLRKYPNLQKADFSKNHLVDATGLKKCTKLRHLNVSHNQLVSLDFSSKLKNLAVFNAGNNQVTSLDPLAALNELKALILNNNSISQTLPVQRLASITTLILSSNRIEQIDVRALSGLSKLQLSHNLIHTFPNIKFNAELKNLLLNDNLIKCVAAICVETSRLDILDLGKNKLKKFKSVEALQHITRLQQLSLRGNPLCEAEQYTAKVLSLLPSLRTFDNKPVQREGRTQHKKPVSPQKQTEEPKTKKKRKRASQPLGEDVPEAEEPDATDQTQQRVQQACSTGQATSQQPARKKNKMMQAFKESLRQLEPSAAGTQQHEGVDALKEAASGVVAISEVKHKHRRARHKGAGHKGTGQLQHIFTAPSAEIGTGGASGW